MTKALLLTASFGDGHHQVAAALREAFDKRGIHVLVEDCFQKTNKWLATINTKSYEFMTRYFPGIYGASYRLTADFRSTNPLWKLLSLSSRKALEEVLIKHQPDIVLQLFPDHASERVIRMSGKPYVGVVITDFSPHSHWFHSNVDTYFIPNGALKSPMEKFVDSHVEFVDSGIPIRDQFRHRTTANPFIPSNPYVLLSSGGRGVFPQLDDVISKVLDLLPTMEIYVLCGRNANMRSRIQKRSRSDSRLHALSFVDDVAPWFRSARFAIIKSGGITVSECLASQCPMVFYRPQPGQEEDNARFLAQKGAGLIVKDVRELEAAIVHGRLLEKFESMKFACRQLARPDAADVIVEHILRTQPC